MNKVFISYSSRHPVYAHLIKNHLLEMRLNPWLDEWDMRGGENWKSEIETAIGESCFALILVVTSEAVKSENVRFEVQTAFQNQRVIIPVIAEKLSAIPAALKKIDTRLVDIKAPNLATTGGYEEGLEAIGQKLTRELDTWAELEKIIQRLGHFSTKIRAGAIKQLTDLRDPRAVEPLIEAMNIDDVPEMLTEWYIPSLGLFRHHLRASFALLKLLDTEQLLTEDQFLTNKVAVALEIGHERNMSGYKNFLITLGHFRPDQQARICRRLANSYDNHIKLIGFNVLLGFLEADNDPRRTAAIYALGQLNNLDALPYLKKLLPTDDEQLNQFIERAINRIENPKPHKKRP